MQRDRRTILVCAAVDLATANAASIHLIELVRAFANRGYETVLIAPRPGNLVLLDRLKGVPGLRLRLVPSLRCLRLAHLPVPNGAHFLLEWMPALVECWRLRPEFVYLRAGFLSWF